MKARSFVVAAPLAGPLILAGPAVAGFVGLTLVHKPNPYALTWNIYAQFDERPDDFVFAMAGTPLLPMEVRVRGGTFYQHVSNAHGGGDLSPDPTLFGAFPSVEFDTFVTIGRKTSISDATARSPGWPGFGPDHIGGNNLGWFVTPDDPQGEPDANNRVLLMQMSTQDGTGFLRHDPGGGLHQRAGLGGVELRGLRFPGWIRELRHAAGPRPGHPRRGGGRRADRVPAAPQPLTRSRTLKSDRTRPGTAACLQAGDGDRTHDIHLGRMALYR